MDPQMRWVDGYRRRGKDILMESFENLLEQQSGLSSEQSEHLMRKMVKSNNQLLAEMKKQKGSTRKRALTGAEASDRQQKAMTRAQTRAKAAQIATAPRKMQTRNQKAAALLADQFRNRPMTLGDVDAGYVIIEAVLLSLLRPFFRKGDAGAAIDRLLAAASVNGNWSVSQGSTLQNARRRRHLDATNVSLATCADLWISRSSRAVHAASETDRSTSLASHRRWPRVAKELSYASSASQLSAGRRLPDKAVRVPGFVNGVRVAAIPDTGAVENFLSAKFAQRNKIWVDRLSDGRQFLLIDGSKVTATGQAQISWSFVGQPQNSRVIKFNVIEGCPDDVVLGRPFLTETKTLSTNSHRLSWQNTQTRKTYGFNSIGVPTHHLPGFLDSSEALAYADSGCDLNIMSAEYAQAHGYHIEAEPDEKVIFILPDGTEAVSKGYVKARWAFKADPGNEIPLYFEIMPNCTYDVVIGGYTLFEHDVFLTHSNHICPGAPLSEWAGMHLVGWRIWRKKRQQKIGISLVSSAQYI
ncbi:MAG: hypothetical protein M1839_006319 [Geoglossum umbratile]|nr:MAG: hypothetical protein M1839_006319 [Geoglossum umbratile]